MLSLTRSFTSRISLTALRATPRLQSSPLIHAFAPYRSFSVTPSVFAAAASRAKTTAKTTTTRGTARAKPKTKSKTTVKAKPKTRAKAKPRARTATRKTRRPKKKATPKPPSTHVPLVARPPKKPASAYFIFFSRTVDSPKNKLEANEATKGAANIWNKMTDAEKKPYFDEYKILYADYVARRAKWYKDPKNASVLRKLNRDRKKHGKTRIHTPEGITPKKPLTGFFRFYQELRETGTLTQANAPTGTRQWVVWAAREAGNRWKLLPQTEKERYNQQFHNDK